MCVGDGGTGIVGCIGRLSGENRADDFDGGGGRGGCERRS